MTLICFKGLKCHSCLDVYSLCRHKRALAMLDGLFSKLSALPSDSEILADLCEKFNKASVKGFKASPELVRKYIHNRTHAVTFIGNDILKLTATESTALKGTTVVYFNNEAFVGFSDSKDTKTYHSIIDFITDMDTVRSVVTTAKVVHSRFTVSFKEVGCVSGLPCSWGSTAANLVTYQRVPNAPVTVSYTLPHATKHAPSATAIAGELHDHLVSKDIGLSPDYVALVDHDCQHECCSVFMLCRWTMVIRAPLCVVRTLLRGFCPSALPPINLSR